MEKLALLNSTSSSGDGTSPLLNCWSDDDPYILNMDCFINTLTEIKAKGVHPDVIGSIITGYASTWLPELSDQGIIDEKRPSSESATASWLKKRFIIETLVAVLPPENYSIPCNFLLRLLKMANRVHADSGYIEELEKRISWQLDQASLTELMIPSFSHTHGTLLDVKLVLRLVKGFVNLDDVKISGADSMKRVAKLVDSYLAEVAVDSNLTSQEFMSLAGAVPAHARSTDDGIYRATDIFLKAHPNVSKKERKSLCELFDTQKLTQEASLHAAQNGRLPVRTIIQVLFLEHAKHSCQIDWSQSFRTNQPQNLGSNPIDQCYSLREMTSKQMEIKMLKEDVSRLEGQCYYMQTKISQLVEKKKKWWKKLGVASFMGMSNATVAEDQVKEGKSNFSCGRQTPMEKMGGRGKPQTKNRRNSIA